MVLVRHKGGGRVMKKNAKIQTAQYSGKLYKVFTWTVFAILILYTISIFIILWFGLINSLKSNNDLAGVAFMGWSPNYSGFPRLYTSENGISATQYLFFYNYRTVVDMFSYTLNEPQYYTLSGGLVGSGAEVQITFWSMLLNSILYTVGCALIQVTGRMIMGYMCSMYKNPVSKFIYGLVVVLMIIPIVGTQPAMLNLVRSIGIFNTWGGIFLMSFTFDGMYFLIFFEFFAGMSASYHEAAEIDGANQLVIMVSIYFPLAMKMFATVFLIRFIELWNDYNNVLLYLPTHPTITYGVYYIFNGGGNYTDMPLTVKYAATMLLAVPTMIIFLIFKERVMGNLSLGGLKE